MKKIYRLKYHYQLNNKGASLLLVIIAFLFLATLGTIIVSAAVKNIEMKTVNKKTKENFYLAEAAMEEIKAGLTEDASKEIADAYSLTLSQYSTKNAAMRKAYFNQNYTDGMKDVLNIQEDLSTGLYIMKNTDLTSYFKETPKYDPTTKTGAEVISDALWQEVDGKAMILKNVAVEYHNGNYTSKVTTDIKMIYPKADFDNLNGYVEITPFVKYALIAQDSLWAVTSSHNITGSVYAGSNGINVNNDNNSINITNGRVISAGNITVTDKASFGVGGTGSEVWATNLITTQTDKSNDPVSDTTSITINGDSYIKDDLIVDAKNSDINLSGQYYGYSGKDSPSTAENNSAITVNAANATLKLDGLNKLYLAGRAFINLGNSTDTYQHDALYGAGDNANSNILTGESLSVKGSQEAYLVPGQFIKVGHNPVSWDEYKLYYSTNSMVNIPSDEVIFNHPSISEEKSKLSYYLNSAEPYKKVFYKFGGNSNMVYYYLNFENKEKATTYLKNFRLCYPDIVYNGFPIKEIVLNEDGGAVVTAGNLVTYDKNDFQIIEGNNGEYINNYSTQYKNLSATLQKFTDSTVSLFDTLIRSDLIKSDASSDGSALVINNPYYVRVIDGDYILNDVNKSGIIIATGNVTVNQSFTGMIIAGGRIELYGGANVDASPTLVTSIINNNDDIKKYFVELNDEGNKVKRLKTINMSDLILYDHWKKN